MIRIFLADDHAFVRNAIRRLLSDEEDMCVVGEAGTVDETMQGLSVTDCDVCLLDLSMPGQRGTELLGRVHRTFPRLRILVLSVHSEESQAVRCIRAGAGGYLCKTSSTARVLNGIRQVAREQLVLKPSLTQELALNMLTDEQSELHKRLSNREQEVFKRLVAGWSVTRIARESGVSVKTISTHKVRIQKKLGCDGTAALVHYAQQQELLDLPAQPQPDGGKQSS